VTGRRLQPSTQRRRSRAAASRRGRVPGGPPNFFELCSKQWCYVVAEGEAARTKFEPWCATRYNERVIKTFRHKGLQRYFESGSKAGIQPGHEERLRMRLAALETATSIEDMNLPGFRLHQLKGDRKGSWAVDVSRNWRVVFSFERGNAFDVDYEDYH
jgi:proteic killer suppression protein